MMDKRLSPIYKNKMDFVDENLSVNAGHLLDVGCGEGHYFSLYKKRNLAFKGIDIDPSMLVNLKKYSVTCADVQKLPFNSSAFDTIVCIDVLEHVKKDKKAITVVSIARNIAVPISVTEFLIAVAGFFPSSMATR